jgi:hypothetical protein
MLKSSGGNITFLYLNHIRHMCTLDLIADMAERDLQKFFVLSKMGRERGREGDKEKFSSSFSTKLFFAEENIVHS